MERKRLEGKRQRNIPWKKWGPYLSERQWGTVREDYSENGDAWNFFTHDHARSREEFECELLDTGVAQSRPGRHPGETHFLNCCATGDRL